MDVINQKIKVFLKIMVPVEHPALGVGESVKNKVYYFRLNPSGACLLYCLPIIIKASKNTIDDTNVSKFIDGCRLLYQPTMPIAVMIDITP